MGPFQMCVKNFSYGRPRGKITVCERTAREAVHNERPFSSRIGASRININFLPVHSINSTVVERLCKLKSPVRMRVPYQRVMAMDSMKVTEEEIARERRRFDRDDVFLRKEELPDGGEDAAEDAPRVGKVGSEMAECWELWQRIGMPVQHIAKQRNMTETGVFFCIFTCIQKNYTVDWYELCKEALFTVEIAERLIKATQKFVSEAQGGQIEMRKLRTTFPPDVSDVHFGLFVTMLGRGLSYDTIKEISVESGGGGGGAGGVSNSVDDERFPTQVTEHTLLKWVSQRNGVSLIDIALKYKECNDLELMRLILKLHEEHRVFWRQGIFRVLASD